MTWISIGICMTALVLTLLVSRASSATLGLPLAYLISLLLIHVPGAYAYAISEGAFVGLTNFGTSISRGIMLTSIATLCFVVGTAIAVAKSHISTYDLQRESSRIDSKFVVFCLLSGWFLTFGVGPLRQIPTIGAAIYFGSSIWMLAAIVGLSGSVRSGDPTRFAMWIGVMMVYPLTVLLFSGFLSYGSAAVIVVGSLALIRMKSLIRSFIVVLALGYLGISVFVNYYGERTELRAVLWSSSNIEQRLEVVSDAFSDLDLFNQTDPAHLVALTSRLNQNEFVGLAAERLENNQSEYLKGRSFRDAVLAPIPRAIWKNKPMEGGSGQIVRDMTGIQLGTRTSWGVGNVMELYINFGLWSLVPGFVLLGFTIGWLDLRAAEALQKSDPSRSLLYFLPAVALIQPNGSLVEVIGGAFAAFLAALGLRFIWLISGLGQPADQRRTSKHPQRGMM